jgi:hypothetical protein
MMNPIKTARVAISSKMTLRLDDAACLREAENEIDWDHGTLTRNSRRSEMEIGHE